MEEQRTEKDELKCQICADRSFRKYVGVVVCASCKMFFKRNAEAGTKVRVREKTSFFAFGRRFRQRRYAVSMDIVRSLFSIGMHAVLAA